MKKILVVDNDKFMLEFMNDILSKDGHEVVTAEGGLCAVDILKTYTPDIIFVDLVMPNIEGKQLCKIIRSMPQLEDVPIVILSAIAAEEDIRVEEFKANACIAKGPVNEMAGHIAEIMDELCLASLTGLPGETIGAADIYSRNITQELLSIKNHYEIVLGKISEGVLEITSGGRIVYANSMALSIIGMPEEKLLGCYFIELFADRDRHRVAGLMKTLGDKPQIITEDLPLRLNGHQVTLHILPVDEYSAASLVILNDITERLQAEEEKRKLEAQLHQAQRMESLGSLAGGIAHDFNNILMGIQGRTSLMAMDKDPTHPDVEQLKGIEKYVEKAAKLTKQLLGLARGGKYEVKPTDINDLVKKSSEMFGWTRKEIAIHSKYQEDVWTVEVDQGQIDQVLMNLYINAWQAMPGGGDLFLETENVTLDESYVKPFSIEPGRYVKLSITDTGVGMDKATQERIFDPFFTTKEMGRGTGLGLASAYGIIKNHGGFIKVSSKKGDGSTFNIYLPASESDVRGQTFEVSDDVRHGHETLLLVDDEEMITEVGKEMLNALGYTVLIAEGGRKAVEIFRKKRDEIDLVILDMIMLGMGGGDTYDRLKEINPDIKVLLSSGYSINGQAKEILDRGCDGFIQKPFNIEQLSQKLREIFGKKQDQKCWSPP